MGACVACGKGARARLYCHRPDCAVLAASTPLPPPNVEAVVNGGTVDVVLSRDNKAKSFRGEGTTTQEAVKDVVKKILDDPHTAEYVRRG